MMDCQLTCRLSCTDSQRAEAIGILIALKRGKLLPVNIQKVDVVTDNQPNYDVLVGKTELTGCKNEDVMMAILQAAKEYRVCRFRCEPRKELGFVDALTKKKDVNPEVFNMRSFLENIGPSRLWGMPFIYIDQKEGSVTKKMSRKPFTFDPESFASKYYYVTVPQEVLKYDALDGLLRVLDPDLLVVMVGSKDSALKISQLVTSMGARGVTRNSDQHDEMSVQECESLILINECKIPLLPAKKALVVVYDCPEDPICYAPSQDVSKIVTVRITMPQEDCPLPHSAELLNPFGYLFFHEGEERKTRTGREGKEKEKPKEGKKEEAMNQEIIDSEFIAEHS